MRRRTLLAVAGWLLAALVATGTGLAAVQVIGAGLTGPAGEVRSPDEVARALAATPPPAAPGAAPSGGTASPVPTTSATPPGGADDSRRLVSTPGGTVLAECAGRRVWLSAWTPAQGYRVGEVERGPDDDAEVTFHGSGGRIEVEVECVGGRPVPTWKAHGGDD
ncbi:septum formation initiator [Plantactinospora veratri]|uniref:Septum formation initiator n=1 Tax=Plantactinospora veratri TaxID=1436122 RepID=A0ABU7SBQ5_9ACTN